MRKNIHHTLVLIDSTMSKKLHCVAILIVVWQNAAGNVLTFPFAVQAHQLQLTRDEEGNARVCTRAHTHAEGLVPAVIPTGQLMKACLQGNTACQR